MANLIKVNYKEIDVNNYSINNLILILTLFISAINDPIYGKKWLEVIYMELRSLIKNEMFREVRKPSNVNIVLCRWVWSIKYRSDHAVER